MHRSIHVLLHSKAAHNIHTQRKQRLTVYSRLSIVPMKKKNTQYAAFGIVAWGASLNCLRWCGSWEAGGWGCCRQQLSSYGCNVAEAAGGNVAAVLECLRRATCLFHNFMACSNFLYASAWYEVHAWYSIFLMVEIQNICGIIWNTILVL